MIQLFKVNKDFVKEITYLHEKTEPSEFSLSQYCHTIRIANSQYRLTIVKDYYIVRTSSLSLTKAVLPAKIQSIMKKITEHVNVMQYI